MTSVASNPMRSETSAAALSADARYYEYTRAANPIASGSVTAVPVASFGAEIYSDGPTRVVPIDLSDQLRCEAPATSPALLASFLRIRAGESLVTDVNATSELFYVLSGAGRSDVDGQQVDWGAGDFVTLPAASRAEHHASADTAMYWVHDEPLLRYLGVTATERRFRPTVFPREQAMRKLQIVASDPDAGTRNRVSILLGNAAMDQTLTVTHVLWAMLGILPKDAVQPPHRHQSVALDLILDCQPGCYTQLGDLDEEGNLVYVERVDWRPGCAFVTPPGKWHSHHNESGADAHLIPIQDAGLHTYLRSLDIRFMTREQAERAVQTAADISPTSTAAVSVEDATR